LCVGGGGVRFTHLDGLDDDEVWVQFLEEVGIFDETVEKLEMQFDGFVLFRELDGLVPDHALINVPDVLRDGRVRLQCREREPLCGVSPHDLFQMDVFFVVGLLHLFKILVGV